MLRVAAAAASAVVFAAASAETSFPASYWEVEEKKAEAHSRRLWPEVYKTTPIFPSYRPAADEHGAESYVNQAFFALDVSLSGNGEFFAINQPVGALPYPAPPGPTAAVPLTADPTKQNGVVNFGKRVGTKAVLTRTDITGVNLVPATLPAGTPSPPGVPPGALSGATLPVTIFGFRSAVSYDGDTMVSSAPASVAPSGNVFVYKKCRSEAGCQLRATIPDPDNEFLLFGFSLAISPDASHVAVLSVSTRTVYVFPLNDDGTVAVLEAIKVVAPNTLTFAGGAGPYTGYGFGSALKLTSKGRRLIVGVAGSLTNDAVLVYRREGKFYYPTDTLVSPDHPGQGTGFGLFAAVAVAEDKDDVSDEDAGVRFTLATGQLTDPAATTGNVYVWRCLKGTQNTCSLKATIASPANSIDVTGSFGMSVSVSEFGETVAVAGIHVEPLSPGPATLFGTVHLFKRAEKAWTYAEKFATYAWGTGGLDTSTVSAEIAAYAIGEVAGFFPLSLSHNGKVLLAGSGVPNAAATLISLADEE